MRITDKMIEKIVVEAVGEDAMPVVKFLKDKKNISEFIIAEKTKVEIHQVRNALYRMHSLNLAVYKRKKDSKKGYYISYWTFNKKKISDVAEKLQGEKLEKLKMRLTREEENKGIFFLCPNACARLDFDNATELDFKCPECGFLLTQQDNAKTIDHLKSRIRELEEAA